MWHGTAWSRLIICSCTELISGDIAAFPLGHPGGMQLDDFLASVHVVTPWMPKLLCPEGAGETCEEKGPERALHVGLMCQPIDVWQFQVLLTWGKRMIIDRSNGL